MDEQWKSYYDLIKAENDRNNAWSASQAQRAMEYQTEMSNSAHQREVADLKAAGLNPVLSAGGAGATTGSGIAASASNENVSALYGLAKQAIDANIKQAEAMANAAKYISGAGGTGSGTPISADDRTTFEQVWDQIFDGKSPVSLDNPPDWLENMSSGLLALAAKYLKIPYSTLKQWQNDSSSTSAFVGYLFTRLYQNNSARSALMDLMSNIGANASGLYSVLFPDSNDKNVTSSSGSSRSPKERGKRNSQSWLKN